MYKLFYLVFFFLSYSLADEFSLEWYVKGENTNQLEFDKENFYGTTNAKGPWEDSLGNFGSLDCTGIFASIDNKDLVNVNCIGIDNNKSRFSVNMKRISEANIGLGKVEYLKGIGKYKHLKGLICNYAVNYSNGYGFYKQKCKVDKKIINLLKQKEN